MNSLAQNKQFMFAGLLSAFLLGLIAVLALRSETSKDSALFICLIDIAAQILFGLTCLWAIRSTALASHLDPFIDHGAPSLRTLATIAPWLVILQIAMGAALRYHLMGAMSHVIGAMLVGAFLLYFSTGVLTPTQPGHPSRTAALALLWLVLAQVLLGIAAYLVRFSGPNAGIPNIRLFTILHIFTAAFILANTWILAHLLRHSARQPESIPST